MTHMRTQIRAAFKQALEAEFSALTHTVFASRKYKINHDYDRVFIDMAFENDQTQSRETMETDGLNERIHVASLYIRVQMSATEEDLDDALDAEEVRIVSAIGSHDWSGILEEDPELLQVNFTEDAAGGRVIGGLVLRFDVEYRIDKYDPETAIE